jgi:hypothetical protein
MHRTKDITRKVKRGRRVYGAIYTLASGEQVYMAWRKTSEIFRGGEKLLSDAISSHKASWAIDDETLRDRKREGIRFIGIWVVDTDDKYIAPIEAFFDKTLAKVMNYETRGGALQRYLPLEHFRLSAGVTKIK